MVCECLAPPPIFDLPAPPDPSLIWHLIAEEPLEVFKKMKLKNSCQLQGKNTLLNLFDSIANLDLWEEGNGIYLALILLFLLLFLGCTTAICVLRWRNQRRAKGGCRSSPTSLNSSKFSTETIVTANTGSATTKAAVVVNWGNHSQGGSTNILRLSPPAYRCTTVATRPYMAAGEEITKGMDGGVVRMYGSQSSINIFAGQQLRPQNGQTPQFYGKTASHTMNRKRPKCSASRVQKQPSISSSQIPSNMLNALQQQAPSNWNCGAYCTLTQPYEYEEISAASVRPPANHLSSPTMAEDSEATVFEDLSENLRYMDIQRRPPPMGRPPPPPRLTAKPYVVLPVPPINSESQADNDLISSSASSTSAASSSSDAELERLAATEAIASPPSIPQGRGLTTRSRTSSELGGSTVVMNGGRESGYGTAKSRRNRLWANQQNVENSPQFTFYHGKPSESSTPGLPAHSNSTEVRRTNGKNNTSEGLSVHANPPHPQRLQTMTYV